MEILKKLALQVADDLAKVGAAHIIMENIKIDIRKHKDVKNKFVFIVTDLDDKLIFEYYTSLVKLEYDFIGITELALDHNVGKEEAAFLGYIIEAWYYGEVR